MLGSVGYDGTPGDSDSVTEKGISEVLALILKAGGVPIPAHADAAKGLLRETTFANPSDSADVRQALKALDANTIRQALQVAGLTAVEWRSMTNVPSSTFSAASRLARVLGSDCHTFRGKNAPGSAYTWVKMGQPTLEGLRLALLDGNDVSLRRSDDQPAFDPTVLPPQVLLSLEVEGARVLGNGTPC